MGRASPDSFSAEIETVRGWRQKLASNRTVARKAVETGDSESGPGCAEPRGESRARSETQGGSDWLERWWSPAFESGYEKKVLCPAGTRSVKQKVTWGDFRNEENAEKNEKGRKQQDCECQGGLCGVHTPNYLCFWGAAQSGLLVAARQGEHGRRAGPNKINFSSWN